MSSPVLEKHNLELHRLYYSKPLPLFDLTDLEKIVYSFDTVFTDAAFRKAIFPYTEGATGLLKMLTTIRENLVELRQHNPETNPFRQYNLQFGDYLFTIPIAHSEIHEAHQALSPLIWETQRSVDDLSQIKATAEREITSEIRPNKVVGTQYLSEAKLLVPVHQPQPGVFVFAMTPDKRSKDLAFTITQLSLTLYSSMNEALRKQTDPLRLETVVVASGTEHYPLNETVLPVLVQKYMVGLCESN